MWIESYHLGSESRPWVVRYSLEYVSILMLRCSNGWSHDMDPYCMFCGYIQILSQGDMDLLCMFCSHVYLSTLLIIDLQCTFGSHYIVIFVDMQCIGPKPWLSQKNELLVLCQLWAHLSLPLIPDLYLKNYFTYHILLASYFGGNFVAPKISTNAWAPFKELGQGLF